MREDQYVADGASYGKRGLEDDGIPGIVFKPSLSSPPEVGISEQETLSDVVNLAVKLQSNIKELLEKIEEDTDGTPSESCDNATPPSKRSSGSIETTV